MNKTLEFSNTTPVPADIKIQEEKENVQERLQSEQ